MVWLNFYRIPQFTSNLLPVQKYLYSLSCIDIKKYIKIVGQLNYTWVYIKLWAPDLGLELHHHGYTITGLFSGAANVASEHRALHLIWLIISSHESLYLQTETCSDTTYQNTNPLGYCSQLTNLIFGGLNWYLSVKASIAGVFLLWGLSSKSSLFLLKIIFAKSDCERIEVNVQTLSGNQTVRSYYCLTRVISTAIKWDQSRFSKDCN